MSELLLPRPGRRPRVCLVWGMPEVDQKNDARELGQVSLSLWLVPVDLSYHISGRNKPLHSFPWENSLMISPR